jgi:hypothetical protein
MRLHVVYDKRGKIVAAVNLEPADSSLLRPVAKKGQASAELEVPKEHAHLSFADVCQRFKVDTRTKNPSLRLKDSPKTRSSIS